MCSIVIPYLPQALHTDNCVVAEMAATCLLHAASSGMDWDALQGSRMRLIRPLINLLRSRNPLSVKVASSRLLQRLSRCQVCVAQLAFRLQQTNILLYRSYNCVRLTVVVLLRCPSAPAEQHSTLITQESRKLVTEAGALILLLRLLKSTYDPAKQAAARAITNVAYGNASVKAELVKAGILDMLNAMLEGLHPVNQEAAALAVANLACSDDGVRVRVTPSSLLLLYISIYIINVYTTYAHDQCLFPVPSTTQRGSFKPVPSMQVLMEGGTLQLVVHVLRDGTPPGRAAAARALRNIVTHHPPAKAAAVDCGAVALLLDLLDSSHDSIRLTAISALGGLAAKNDRIHGCIALESAVTSLVAALGDAHASVVESAATTLASLCTTNDARHALAASGGVEALAGVLRLRVGEGTAGQLQAARVAAAQAVRVLVSCEMHAIKQVRVVVGVAILCHSSGGMYENYTYILCIFDTANTPYYFVYSVTNMLQIIITTQAVANSGVITHLAAMLSGGDGDAAQKAAAGALWNLAYKNEDNRNVIRNAGAIPPLVRLLKSYQPEGMRREAARAISNLSCNNHSNQVAIAASGAIPPLVHLLQSGSPCSVEAAARALSNLALQDENQADIAAAGAVPALLQLMASGSEACQEAAVRAYGNVIVNNHHAAVAMTAARAIPLLKELLCREGKRTLQLEAARALGNLACLGTTVQADIVASGVVTSLIKMLDSGHEATRGSAACTLWDISYDNDLARRAVVAGNGVPYLVQALLFGCAGTKEAAASTLMELACLGQRSSTPPSTESTPRDALSLGKRAARQAATQVGRGSDDGTSVASVVGDSGAGSEHSGTEHSRTVSDCGLTGAEVRAAIIEAGAMPLLIQMAGSGDSKLQAVGSRALEVMGYSSSSEEVQRGAFPRVSAYHQPALMQPQLLAARF